MGEGRPTKSREENKQNASSGETFSKCNSAAQISKTIFLRKKQKFPTLQFQLTFICQFINKKEARRHRENKRIPKSLPTVVGEKMTSQVNVNGGHGTHPQTQQHYYQQRSSSSSSASFKGCCCCLFLLLTFLALLLIAVVLVIVLAVKPRKPEFDLQQVGVQYVLVTPSASTVASTAAYLSLNITMVFTAVNPNKVGIKYSSSAFYVMYKGVPLGLATMPGFYQPAHSSRTVSTTVSVDRVNVLQADAQELLRDAALNDKVELGIMGDVGAKIRIVGINSPRVKVSVDCGIVISPKKQSLTYKQCGVDGLSV